MLKGDDLYYPYSPLHKYVISKQFYLLWLFEKRTHSETLYDSILVIFLLKRDSGKTNPTNA